MTRKRSVAQVAVPLAIAVVAVGMSLRSGIAAPAAEEAKAAPPAIDLSEGPAFPLDGHLESEDVAAGALGFQQVFDAGDKLFHSAFTGRQGAGVLRLPDGTPLPRFSVSPPGHGALAAISAQSCGGCHNLPFAAAAGSAESSREFDFDSDGKPPFNVRSTISLHGNGILQLLAQEMTEDLHAIRDEAEKAAKAKPGSAVRRDLTSKNISYGAITATADPAGKVSFDLSGLQGVDPDLVVRPFGWKGSLTTVRSIVVGANALLMGIQAEELVRKMPKEKSVPDPDGDGVERELSVGDVTAITAYNAAQETPQPIARLAELGMVAAPSADSLAAIEKGRAAFRSVGCETCHVPELRLRNTVFEEPTLRGKGRYYDTVLAGLDKSYDPARPLRFDVLKDAQPPRAAAHPEGGAAIQLYGDLKRHTMGRQLADLTPQPSITALGAPLMQDDKMVLLAPTAFLTPELWGVGNTGPWLHDGRAGTLEEAVLLHGEDQPPAAGDPGRSEAQEARDAFKALPAEERQALLTFLRSLQTFSPAAR
jgi:hypothetical protein